jgi:hypothetical protein
MQMPGVKGNNVTSPQLRIAGYPVEISGSRDQVGEHALNSRPIRLPLTDCAVTVQN